MICYIIDKGKNIIPKIAMILQIMWYNADRFFFRQVADDGISIIKLIILFSFLFTSSVWVFSSSMLRKGKVKPMTEFLFATMDILVQFGINLCSGMLPFV